VAIAIAIVAVVVVAAVIVVAHRSTPNSPYVLIPGLTVTALTGGQFYAINFVTSNPAVLNGTYSTNSSVQFYVMTPTEYQYIIAQNKLSGYVDAWSTQGFVALAYLEQPVAVGQWVFVMENPSATVGTDIGWLTPLTLATA